MKKITIIGATGMLGQPLAKALIQAGFEVTLFVREPEKARRLFGASVRLIKGDLRDVNSIRPALAGQDQVYLNLSVHPSTGKGDFQPEREGLDNIMEAVKTSGIKRMAYLSSLVHFYQGQNNFNWWVFDMKQEAVRKIKSCGRAYSIFYPSMFMECFDKGAYRQGNKLMLAGTSKHRMYLISGSDYGKQVAKALQREDGNQEYYVQGPEAYLVEEAARYFVKNYRHGKLRILSMPLGLMKFFGLFSKPLHYGSNIVEALNHYPERFQAEKTWQDLGKPETSFLDYIKNSP